MTLGYMSYCMTHREFTVTHRLRNCLTQYIDGTSPFYEAAS